MDENLRISSGVNVPTLVMPQNKQEIDVRYVVIAPFVSVHVYWDSSKQETVYELEEPKLSMEEQEMVKKIEDSVQEMININFITKDRDEDSQDYIDKLLKIVISELNLKVEKTSYPKLFYYLYRDFVGLNKIEGFMKDYFIEDIECNGVGQPIYIVHRVFRNLRTNVKFDSVEESASFVEKLSQKAGKAISYANPLLDGSLPDGSRVNATYTKDVSSKGPTFTIRKFTKTPWTPIQLMDFETVSPEMLAYFWLMMEHKMNVLISGGTASGKTTLLNAIAFFIPPEARVVSIEDTRELNLPRENWLPSVARQGTSKEGGGNVDMFDLLKSSFRQNPDYVIVGEVRGAEASVLFQGMASGHASIGTIHADSPETIIRRLETPPINLSPTLVNELDAVAIMTHVIVNGREVRKLRDVSEIINVDANGIAQINKPFVWDARSNTFYSKKDIKVFKKIEERRGIPVEELYNELNRRAKLLYELSRRGIVSFDDLRIIVNEYYKNPKRVLEAYGVD
jgi:flagellar protein FlaI